MLLGVKVVEIGCRSLGQMATQRRAQTAGVVETFLVDTGSSKGAADQTRSRVTRMKRQREWAFVVLVPSAVGAM